MAFFAIPRTSKGEDKKARFMSKLDRYGKERLPILFIPEDMEGGKHTHRFFRRGGKKKFHVYMGQKWL